MYIRKGATSGRALKNLSELFYLGYCKESQDAQCDTERNKRRVRIGNTEELDDAPYQESADEHVEREAYGEADGDNEPENETEIVPPAPLTVLVYGNLPKDSHD